MKFKNKNTREIKEFDYILIDSAKLSSQTRKRLYWTNIPNVTQPQDLGLLLKDIVHENEEQPTKITDRNIHHFKHLNM